MKKGYARLSDAFNRMSIRERGLITLALAALCYFACDLLLVQPELKRQQEFAVRLGAQHSETQQLERELAQLAVAQVREDAEQARIDLQQGRQQAGPFVRGIPRQSGLAELARSVLDPMPGLRLLSLRTLPARPVTTPDVRTSGKGQGEGSTAVTEAPVHLHGLEFNLSAPYLSLLPYLQRLQAFPEPLLWGDLSLKVVTHPESLLRVNVSTVSEQAHAPLGG